MPPVEVVRDQIIWVRLAEAANHKFLIGKVGALPGPLHSSCMDAASGPLLAQ